MGIGLVTDEVWVFMSLGMAPNKHVEVNIIDANTTTTITDRNLAQLRSAYTLKSTCSETSNAGK